MDLRETGSPENKSPTGQEYVMDTIKLNAGFSFVVETRINDKGTPVAAIASVGKDGKRYALVQLGTAGNLQSIVDMVREGHIDALIRDLVAKGDKTLEARRKAAESRTQSAPAPKTRISAETIEPVVTVPKKPGRPAGAKNKPKTDGMMQVLEILKGFEARMSALENT